MGTLPWRMLSSRLLTGPVKAGMERTMRAPSVVGIQPSGKASFRYSLELEDGSIRKVPRPRIKGPWAKAAEIDELVNHQVRLHVQRSGEEEDSAARFMIESCRLGEAMELGSGDDFVITDAKALEELVDSPLDVFWREEPDY